MENVSNRNLQEHKKNEILRAMRGITEDIEGTDKTYFIELVGTPKSGKTSLVKGLIEMAKVVGFPLIARRETAEYNPVNKNSDLYSNWMIFELYRNVCEDMECKHGNIVIYDRGILDRLSWIKKDMQEGSISENDARIFENLYDLQLARNYKPILYNFITSPELSIQRKGKTGKFVNQESIQRYNSCLLNSREFLRERAHVYRECLTDQYEGDLEGFVFNAIYAMTKDLQRQLSKDKKSKMPTISFCK